MIKNLMHSKLCKLPLFLAVNTTIVILANLTSDRALLRVHAAAASTMKPPQQRVHNQHNQQQQQQTTTSSDSSEHSAHAASEDKSNAQTAANSGGSSSSGGSSGGGGLHESSNALTYLQRYGYMQAPVGTSNNHLISEESFSSAISEFQQFAGLPATGQVDNQTLAMMQMPRCGNTDKPGGGGGAHISKLGALKRRRLKRYALQGSKWRRQELTYRISQYPTKFSTSGRRHEVDAQIERAFGIWSAVAPIDFVVKRDGRVHIDIRFASGDHGDGDAFDGPGNTLAHAYFPQYGGDAHFDDQEYWTVDSYAGTNIFQVAAHELGHSLGLGHSNVREALMAPFYQKYKPNFKLHLDDVLAIQALYGEKALLPPPTTTTTSTESTITTSSSAPTTPATTGLKPLAGGRHPPIYKGKRRPPFGRGHDEDSTSTTTTPTPTTITTTTTTTVLPSGEHENSLIPELPTNGLDDATTSTSAASDLCSDSALDAITRTEDGSTYVFKGDHYWLLTNEGLAKGYPRPISVDWEGLPSHLDAALTWADGKTFFFKGNKYWRFRNKRRDLGYPKLISAGFAGVPDDIDAAFVWSGNGRTYFFKGTEYWRFDSKAEPPVASDYPRSIKVWLGVPAYVNAAFKWENNVTYFFKGSQYYRFNDREFKVEARGRPAFPRQTSEWWFGCVNSNLAQRALPAGQAVLLPPPPHRAAASEATTRQQRGSQLHNTVRLNYASEHAMLSGASATRGGGGGLPAVNSFQSAFPTNNNGGVRASLQQQVGAFAAPTTTTSGGADNYEWSLLAGLSEEQTRPLGTHISDHQHNSGGEQQHTREQEASQSASDAGGQQRLPRQHTEPLDVNFVPQLSVNKRTLSEGSRHEQDLPLGPSHPSALASPSSASSSSSSSSMSAIFMPHAQAGISTKLLIFMCTLIASITTTATTTTTSLMSLNFGRRHLRPLAN